MAKGRNSFNRMICPVLLIGSHSVMPCTIPCRIDLRISKKESMGAHPFSGPAPGPRSSVLQVDLIEKVPQKDDFVRGNGHALAHLLVIRRPFPDVVFRPRSFQLIKLSSLVQPEGDCDNTPNSLIISYLSSAIHCTPSFLFCHARSNRLPPRQSTPTISGKSPDDEALDRFAAELREGDHLTGNHASGRQGPGAADSAEIHPPMTADGLHDIPRTRAFAYSSTQAEIMQAGREKIHPSRRRGAAGQWEARRGGVDPE